MFYARDLIHEQLLTLSEFRLQSLFVLKFILVLRLFEHLFQSLTASVRNVLSNLLKKHQLTLVRHFADVRKHLYKLAQCETAWVVWMPKLKPQWSWGAHKLAKCGEDLRNALRRQF